ncbi:MAG: C40 family peptidase [Azonexus sp.]|nr:C40 family peptidase [Azonexus sp.]MCK6413848.1 C40 family peptidase [Azonexus sp.]
MSLTDKLRPFLCALIVCGVAACGSLRSPVPPLSTVQPPLPSAETRLRDSTGNEIALFALGLIDTGYRFGGKNPEAGLDCSGMVSYILERAAGIRVRGSAADIARQGRVVASDELRPGDLVFFNTRNAPFSHVGIYIGDERFVHAPNRNGKVRIDRIADRYYAQRFEAARTFID